VGSRGAEEREAMKFPKHEAALWLTHNQHKNYYQTVKESIAQEEHGYQDDCWISDEQKQKAIDTNECWTIQWYPDTPVGFCIKSAADLDVLLEHVNK
jgi:hypothetical protein